MAMHLIFLPQYVLKETWLLKTQYKNLYIKEIEQ